MTPPAFCQPDPNRLSPLAKACALEALEVLGSPDHHALVTTTANMAPQHIMAMLLRTIGKLACSEATTEEIRGALLMATAWISAAAEAMAAQNH
ncbi:MAG: hypothetical protein RKO25_01770 [Candidatus Contendobacter sp.]|nr:hypothetical protein [Candidatus Contendobacter sp.]